MGVLDIVKDKKIRFHTISAVSIPGAIFANKISENLIYCIDYEGGLRILEEDPETQQNHSVKNLREVWSGDLDGMSRKGLWPYFISITGQISRV